MRDDSRVSAVLFMAIKFHLTTKMPAKKKNRKERKHKNMLQQKCTFRVAIQNSKDSIQQQKRRAN